MSKKFNLFLISMLVIGIVIVNIPHTYALPSNAKLSFDGSSTVGIGMEFTIDILASEITGSNLMGAQGNVTSSVPSCVSFVKLTRVIPTNVNNNIFAYADTAGEANDFVIAKATFQAGNTSCTTTINITEPKISFVDGTKTTLDTISKTITVDEKITSIQFGHDISDDYIKTVAETTTGLDMKNQLDNENAKLQIWSSDDSREIADTDVVGTGMIVKLIVNGAVVDSKVIIIRGDTTGDGEIDIFDSTDLLNHIVGRFFLSGAYLVAADVDKSDEIDIFDSTDILNHIVGRKLIVFL